MIIFNIAGDFNLPNLSWLPTVAQNDWQNKNKIIIQTAVKTY